MSEKTICFFNSAKTWGGGEKWHYETALFLQQSGYKVLFVAGTNSVLQKKLAGKLPCISLPVGNLSFLNPLKVIRLKKIFEDHRVGTILINLSADLKLAGLAAKSAGVGRIIYRRGSAIPVKNNFINRFYFSKILTDVLANSEATKKTVLQNNPSLIAARKIRVIYNPIDTTEFIRRKFNPLYAKMPEELVIGNIGRLVPQKNHQFLIDLAVVLKTKPFSFKILIGGSGPLEAALKKEAAAKGVSDKIIFFGFVENVKDLLMCCDLFVLPSLWEGFGYVLAEAALCEKPAIAFNISSNPELVTDSHSGFLCPAGDQAAVIDKICRLQQDRQQRKILGEQGKSLVIEKFDAAKIKAQLSDYISRRG